MGSGVSTEQDSYDGGDNNIEPTVIIKKNVDRKKLMNLFELSDAPDAENYFAQLNKSISTNDVSKETETLLLTALDGLYSLNSSMEKAVAEGISKMDVLIRAMIRETKSAGELLTVEGESGTKLYVIESGQVQVTINGNFIREMSAGTLLGELSLLYDAPRSATVKCSTECVVWSMSREIFKKVQASTSSMTDLTRSRWLINCPELAILSQLELSKLLGLLQVNKLKYGAEVYKAGNKTNTISLIEKGSAKIYTPVDLSSKTSDEIDAYLGVIRPRQDTLTLSASRSTLDIPPPGESYNEKSILPDGYYACDVSEGCILGIGILKAKAGMNEDKWIWKDTDAECPITMMVQSESADIVSFTVDTFENLFGPTESVLLRKPSLQAPTTKEEAPSKKSIEKIFDVTRVTMKYVLGSGNFGAVVMADHFEGSSKVQYAMKILSKVAVIETGQVRHVLDERKLLSIMNNPFILKFYGTYQSPHQLFMVTEPLQGGDLWNVIYETHPYDQQGGLSPKLAQFYLSSIMIALGHIHSKGIVYRDLKPENILFDLRGYLRIIDFGFAKEVPYTTVVNGEKRLHAKTYTLCGTPEYLSPELIFNLGHDHSSDIWAVGVVFHEMLMGSTPFRPKQADNVTELFTNIALVKKHGLKLSAKFEAKYGNSPTSELMTILLRAEPAERNLAVSGNIVNLFKTSDYFKGIDIKSLEKQEIVPEFIPPKQTQFDSLDVLAPVKQFKGDQQIFAAF